MCVSVASGECFGAKRFSKGEIEAAVRDGLALESLPVRPLGAPLVGLYGLNLQDFFIPSRLTVYSEAFLQF